MLSRHCGYKKGGKESVGVNGDEGTLSFNGSGYDKQELTFLLS